MRIRRESVKGDAIVLDSLRVMFLYLLASMHELQNDRNRKKSCLFFALFEWGESMKNV